MPIAPGPFKLVELVLENDENLRLWGDALHFVSLDGVGVAPVRRILERSPMHHGMVDRGFRLDVRRMTMALYIEGNDLPHSDRLRDRLSYGLTPTNNPVKLRVTRDDDRVRQIDCFVDGEADYPSSQRMGVGQPVVVPLIAPDPSWYDPTQVVESGALTNGTNTFNLDVTGTTWRDWPVITIVGPVDAGFSITRNPGGAFFTFTTGLTSTETVTIDTRPYFKRITSSDPPSFGPAFNYVDPLTIPAFADFYVVQEKEVLVIDPGATPAVTSYVFGDVAGTSGSSQVSIAWYKRYISL